MTPEYLQTIYVLLGVIITMGGIIGGMVLARIERLDQSQEKRCKRVEEKQALHDSIINSHHMRLNALDGGGSQSATIRP